MLYGKTKIGCDQSSHTYYELDENGINYVPHRFTIIKSKVFKGTDYQYQWTIPVDEGRFGRRVTIRWWSNNMHTCQVSLITGGGTQNGINPNPFIVLESGVYNDRAVGLLDMVARRILQLRKETPDVNRPNCGQGNRRHTIYHKANN
ncbi:hypothetical protein IBZ20DMU1_43 [Acinetobacter phage DMU1]|nr:hypothetical protein IBZ20DMU1_43 [Acinetobacter phage DMU1]